MISRQSSRSLDARQRFYSFNALKTTFDQTTTQVSHVSVFSYRAPHVLMSVLVNIFVSSYHGVMMYAPIDSVSSHDQIDGLDVQLR